MRKSTYSCWKKWVAKGLLVAMLATSVSTPTFAKENEISAEPSEDWTGGGQEETVESSEAVESESGETLEAGILGTEESTSPESEAETEAQSAAESEIVETTLAENTETVQEESSEESMSVGHTEETTVEESTKAVQEESAGESEAKSTEREENASEAESAESEEDTSEAESAESKEDTSEAESAESKGDTSEAESEASGKTSRLDTIKDGLKSLEEKILSKDDGIALADEVSGVWSYTVSEGRVTVTGYNGTSSSITIPARLGGYNVYAIGEYAFAGSEVIKSVVIPKNVTVLRKGAFKNCINLTSVTINGDIADCSDWASTSLSADYSAFYNAGRNAGGITVTFASGVTRVPAYLFATAAGSADQLYANVKKVVISDTVKSVGEFAFYRCYGLKTVQLGNKVGTIGVSAFDRCTSLTSINFPNSLTSIGDYGFVWCESLPAIVLPKSLTQLGRGAFSQCINLTSVTINGDIADCSDWASTSLSADYSTFYNAGENAGGVSVTFGSGVTRIPAYLFATGYDKTEQLYAHVVSVDIPSTVQSIGKYAFYKCYDLKSAAVRNSSVYFGEGAFAQCSSELTFYGSTSGSVAEYANDNGYKVQTIRTFQVVFNANSGSGTMAKQTITYGVSTPLNAVKFKRTGYSFNGWYAYRASDKKWYTTKGWKTQAQINANGYKKYLYSDKAKVAKTTSVNKDTVTMYAQWKKNTYTVAFNANGGKGSMSNQKITYSVSTALKKNTFTRTGYTFKGWYAYRASDKKWYTTKGWKTAAQIKSNGYTKYLYGNKANVAKQSSVNKDTVTLYAQWKRNTYTVSFNANGGSGTMSNQKISYGVSTALNANKFKRSGYTFKGWTVYRSSDKKWYTNKGWKTQAQINANGYKKIVYENKAKIAKTSSVNGDKVTMYAQWKKK